MSYLPCDGRCGFRCWYWDAVQLVIFCGCRWVTGVGVIVGGGRSGQVGASRMCRGVAGVGCIVGMRDVVCVGRGGGCRGVTGVGVFDGSSVRRSCIGCGGGMRLGKMGW